MDEHVIKTYLRAAPVFVHGEGATLVDSDGKEYLDFLGGIAVSALGHNHPELVAALSEQLGKVMHVSNLYRHPYTEEVARRITRLAGMAEVFFCNSGTEANEAALKLALKYHFTKDTRRRDFVALQGAFHGRTLGALAVTHKASFREPFSALESNVTFVPRDDIDGLRAAIATNPAALILEPIQGEAGIHELSAEFLQAARQACTDSDTILIHDEIQTGAGRTGTFLCAQHADVTPDIATLAKPIAAGVPMGLTLISDKLSGTFVPGDHGSTFAGGPLACRAALVLLEQLLEGGLQDHVVEMGTHLSSALDSLVAAHPLVLARRGRGLMQAIQLDPRVDAPTLKDLLLESGLIVNATGPDTIRVLPPSVVQRSQIDYAVKILRQGIDAL
ncbi:MAG: acetylornithine/succinylornithine family transaminase [Planctomycetota bacterium]|nr:acetylornithine/succinylornithine family transaminase [Planctomycetota bacterium]